MSQSIFMVDSNKGFIWAKPEEDDDTDIDFITQPQYKNRFVHVWGAISYQGKSDLFIHTGVVDSLAY